MLVMIRTTPCECFYAVRQGLFEELVWSGIVRPVGYLAERCNAPLPNVRIRNKNARALRGRFRLGDWSHVLESHYPGLDTTLQWD